MRTRMEDTPLHRPLIREGLKLFRESVTITAAKTLTVKSPVVQLLTASGGNQNCVLPAEASSDGFLFLIRNVGASNNVVVKASDGTTTIRTLQPGKMCEFYCDGTTWYPVDQKNSDGNGIFAFGTSAVGNGVSSVIVAVSNMLSTDIVLVTMQALDASSRYAISAVPAANQFVSALSGATTSAAGVLGYCVLRP